MPIHIQTMNSHITAVDNSSAMDREQVDMLVEMVLERLQEQSRMEQRSRDRNKYKPGVTPRPFNE